MDYLDLNMGFKDQNEWQRTNASVGDGEMITKSKTVVLWGSEDILISSVESILTSNKEWRVVSISNKEGIDGLIQAVETTHANIVIMQQGEYGGPCMLPMQLIKDLPSLKVITVSLENNSMEVFSKQKILVKEVSDLISVFDNDP